MKCPKCKALLMMRRRIINNRLRGLVKVYYCNICDEPVKTFKPANGEVAEYIIPHNRKATLCGDCLRLAAVHFETVTFVLRSGHKTDGIVTQCEQCRLKTEADKEPLPIPKVKRPRQIKGYIGPVIYGDYSFE